MIQESLVICIFCVSKLHDLQTLSSAARPEKGQCESCYSKSSKRQESVTLHLEGQWLQLTCIHPCTTALANNGSLLMGRKERSTKAKQSRIFLHRSPLLQPMCAHTPDNPPSSKGAPSSADYQTVWRPTCQGSASACPSWVPF